MKKVLKSITALCLVVAMLSTLFVGTAFATETPALVEWYGFEQEDVKVKLEEGTYCQEPVLFPLAATETDLTWTVTAAEPEGCVTIADETSGEVTLNAVGTATITATILDGSGLVADPELADGASYELNVVDITEMTAAQDTVVVPYLDAKEVEIEGAQGVVRVSGNTNPSAVTAQFSNGTLVLTSIGTGYAVVTLTDGAGTEVKITAIVAKTDAQTDFASYLKLFPNPPANPEDPETNPDLNPELLPYMQWYYEQVPSSTIIGYGTLLNGNLLNAATNYIGDKDMKFEPESNYSNFRPKEGYNSFVTGSYHVFSVKMPKAGNVNVSSAIEAYTVNGPYPTIDRDGAYSAIFLTRDEATNRVFPAESGTAPSVANTDVIENWMWMYTQNYEVLAIPDNAPADSSKMIYGKNLRQKDVDRLADFNKNGYSMNVEKDDIIHIIMHCGANQNSEGTYFSPKVEYLDADLTVIDEIEKEINIANGQTTTITPRFGPAWVEPAVSLTPVYVQADKAGASELTSFTAANRQNEQERGMIDITFFGHAAGVGFYRIDVGSVSRLIKIKVGAAAAAADEDMSIAMGTYNNAFGALTITFTKNVAGTMDITPIGYIESTYEDGAIKLDSTRLPAPAGTGVFSITASGPKPWLLGRGLAGTAVNLFFFTDLATLTVPSESAIVVDKAL